MAVHTLTTAFAYDKISISNHQSQLFVSATSAMAIPLFGVAETNVCNSVSEGTANFKLDIGNDVRFLRKARKVLK
jgi:hypothetical protein